MNLIIKLLICYLILSIILIHASLFFCHQSHCAFVVSNTYFSNQPLSLLKVTFSTLLPIELKLAQLLGQWFILAQTLILLYYLVSFIKQALCFIFTFIFVAIIISIAYGVYEQYQNNPQAVEQMAQKYLEWGRGMVQGLLKWINDDFNRQR